MNKTKEILEQLNNGKIFHNTGQIDAAESIYREVLLIDKDNAEALGLLAIIALQRKDIPLAKRMWKRAIEAQSTPWVYLSNLLSYFQFLVAQGAEKEARKLIQKTLPDWPAVRVPDSGERDMLISLANILVKHKNLDAALRLLKSVASALPKDAILLHALGKIHYRKGDISSARKSLSEADAALHHQPNFQLLDDLHQCAIEDGDKEGARAIKSRLAAKQPIYISSAKSSQRAQILVLNAVNFADIKSFQHLHFNTNYPSQIARILANDFNFSSVFAEFPVGRTASKDLPKPDLIINNLTNGELLLSDGNLEEISEFADSFGVPVVNHPQNAILTTREKSAELISNLPAVLVPKICRFSRTDMAIDNLVDAIESEFEYPFIWRDPFLHQGRGLLKIDNRGALKDALHLPGHADFLITEFIDSRGATGYYRKLRAAFVGNEVVIVRVDHSPSWLVHGMRKDDERIAFYLNNPIFLEIDNKICLNPDKELGPYVMQALLQIRDCIPLEIFGIDFDVAPDGRLVFYEANATMNLLSTARPEVDYPKHAQKRLISAFQDFLSQLTRTRKE